MAGQYATRARLRINWAHAHAARCDDPVAAMRGYLADVEARYVRGGDRLDLEIIRQLEESLR